MTGDDERPRAVSGEVFAPNQRDPYGAQGGHLPISRPPAVPSSGLLEGIAERYRLWGLSRTLEAYRFAVEKKLHLVKGETALLAGLLELEETKARLENRHLYRAAVMARAEADLAEAVTRRNRAQIAQRQSEIELADGETQVAIAEFQRMIRLFNAEAERDRAQANLESSQEALKPKPPVAKVDGYKAELDSLDERMANYRELMAKKAEYAKEFGGEENIPGFLVTLLEQMEDRLGFARR